MTGPPPARMTWKGAGVKKTSEAEDFWAEAETLGRALAATLNYAQGLGLAGLPVKLPPLGPAAGLGPTAGPKSPDAAPGAPAHWAPKARDLASLAGLASRCRACPRGRTRSGDPAFGRGSAQPHLVLVGSDPGIHEGPEADLLAAILEKGFQLDPSRFYITSILKCPAGSEEAEPAEALSACLAVTFRELALLAPRVILALGETPGRSLTGQPGTPLGLLRDSTFHLEDPPEAWLRVTFSLEQLLATPDLKQEAWKDFRKVKNVLDKLICDS